MAFTLFALGISTASAALPPDFQATQIIGSGLDGPSAFEFAPDGRIFILERAGLVKVYKNGALLDEPFVDLPSIAYGDRGLIGIAFDPNFASNHYVYFYYTGLDELNRLVRFDATQDVATGGPTILYQTTFPSELLHVGGSIRFGLDGTIYFAVGDNGNPPLAQRLDNPHGKILRINKDGSIPADNPFVGTPGALPEIWAYGLRNPWRFQIDSATGRLYGGDVGNFTWEEVNLLEKGKNYGWPLHEGLCDNDCDGFTDPQYTYNHNGESAAVVGGPIYRDTLFPSEYQNALFFSDYAVGFIKYMKLDDSGDNAGVFDFDTDAGSVVDLKAAADGSLYYITYYPGRLYRVTYGTDSHLPIASASADVTHGLDPLTVEFSSNGTSDPDGDALTFGWDFGDGTASPEANPTKVFTEKGTYTVQLTVSDGSSLAQAVPLIIQVGTPPTLTIGAPNDGRTFRAGDTVSYQASAVDGAGNDLNDGDIVTEILFHHATHTHPFLEDLVGRTNAFTIPATGEAASDIWYEIIVTATDENGLSATQLVNVYPLTSDMTFLTEPSGLAISLEGSPYDTPRTITGVRNFQRQLGAPTLQTKDGLAYQFNRWAHGGAQTQTLVTPEEDTTYTAIFSPATPFTAEYFANRTLSGTPTLTRDEPIVAFDWGGGSPAPTIPNDNFSARFTKTDTFAGGAYNFSVTGDDGVRLFIDNVLVLDQWIDQGPTLYQVSRDLSAGEHNLRLEYYENGGGAVVRLDYQVTNGPPTPPPAPTGGWSAKYWNTPGVGGSPAVPTTTPTLSRSDTAVDFDWGLGSPDVSITNDHFVAQWTQSTLFEAGTYRFTTMSDDGIRVFIDGAAVIDEWDDHATTTHTADTALSAGTHVLTVEFYENSGDAVVQFDSVKLSGPTPPPTPSTGFVAEYFDNRTLSGAPTVTRDETAIDFDWALGSPAASIPNDDFSARFTKTVAFTQGDYRFTVTADDGVRLYLDGGIIIDKWIDQGATTYTVDRTLAAGDHTFRVEYYEHTEDALLEFSFAATGTPPTPPLTPTEWQAQYWNIPGTESEPTMPVTPADLTRNENDIDFDWGYASPGVPIATDHFVARFTKSDSFDAATYRFTTMSDDGIRVFVDDAILISQWHDHGATVHTADITLSAGTHVVRVEFYDNTEDAIVQVDFVKLTAPDPQPTPDPVPEPTPTPEPALYEAEYFDNPTLSGSPELTQTEDTIDFDWGLDSPDSSIPDDDFSARFTKTEVFAAGTYRFEATADDGVRLRIDGETVIDAWIDQGPTTYTADQVLSAGEHTIVLEYYERGEEAVLELVQSFL